MSKIIIDVDSVKLGPLRAVARYNSDQQIDAVVVEHRVQDEMGGPSWRPEIRLGWAESKRDHAIVFELLQQVAREGRRARVGREDAEVLGWLRAQNCHGTSERDQTMRDRAAKLLHRLQMEALDQKEDNVQ
jgi:hypothetical protein